MKKYFLAFGMAVMLLMTAVFLHPDTYIKETSRMDLTKIPTKSNKPVDESVNEFWLGNGKAIAITRSRVVILDKTRNRVFFVLPATKTYIESPLPMDSWSLRSNQVGAALERLEFKVAVTPTSRTKTIKNRLCKEYMVENWVLNRQQQTGEVKRTLWVTTDVPFKLDLYWEVVTLMLQLVNDDEGFFKEMAKIKGLTMASESYRTVQGLAAKTVQQVVEISEKKAPAGIYSVPPDYTKKETLSISDLVKILKD